MTELNPRAWSIDGECWCTRVDYDGYKKEWSGIVPVLAPDNRSKYIGEIEDTNIIVEFPTGLKDKNGKEIYEGDIVRIVSESFLEPSVGIVGFNEDKGIYDTYITENNKVYWEAGSCLCSLMGREDYTTEVIGNIHENPELLEHKG